MKGGNQLVKNIFISALIMPQNTQKNISHWTEKHLKYSLKYKLKYVVTTLWQWLLEECGESKDTIISLKEFQDYVEKLKGEPFTFHWVRKQFDKLVFLRIVHIDKDFGHNTYRIQLRHPDATIPKIRKEKNLTYHHVSVEKEASNDCNSGTCLSSSSSSIINENRPHHTDNVSSNNSDKKIEKPKPIGEGEKKRRLGIIKLCAKYGIRFNPKKATTEQLYKHTYWEVEQALETFKKREKTTGIDNPQGWLITCLRYKFYEDECYSEESFIADIMGVFFNAYKHNSPNVF